DLKVHVVVWRPLRTHNGKRSGPLAQMLGEQAIERRNLVGPGRHHGLAHKPPAQAREVGYLRPQPGSFRTPDVTRAVRRTRFDRSFTSAAPHR
ncbi:MAG: hypothetical protein ACYDD0_05705, partial [Candidatus Dormibacteria bacterium]